MFANIAIIHATRSRDLTMLGLLRRPNAALWWVTGGTLAALPAVIYVPSIASIFRFAPLALGDFALGAAAGVAGVLWYEIYKLLKPRSA